MINFVLFKKEFKSNYKLIIIFIAVLTLYSSMIIAMYDPKMGESLEQMAKSMPEIFAAFGMAEVGTTLLEFMENYLYGFILIVFPSLFIILISNKLMARYIDRGSMAYLLATPNKRSKIAFTQALFVIFSSLILVIYVTALCMFVSESMFPGEMDFNKLILLNIGLYGLLLLFGGICFCSSCVFNDIKLSYGVGAGLVIAFILIQMISQVGEKFEDLKYATPLTLFDTNGIISGDEKAYIMFGVLYLAGLIFFGIGINIFSKRDLPL